MSTPTHPPSHPPTYTSNHSPSQPHFDTHRTPNGTNPLIHPPVHPQACRERHTPHNTQFKKIPVFGASRALFTALLSFTCQPNLSICIHAWRGVFRMSHPFGRFVGADASLARTPISKRAQPKVSKGSWNDAVARPRDAQRAGPAQSAMHAAGVHPGHPESNSPEPQ